MNILILLCEAWFICVILLFCLLALRSFFHKRGAVLTTEFESHPFRLMIRKLERLAEVLVVGLSLTIATAFLFGGVFYEEIHTQQYIYNNHLILDPVTLRQDKIINPYGDGEHFE